MNEELSLQQAMDLLSKLEEKETYNKFQYLYFQDEKKDIITGNDISRHLYRAHLEFFKATKHFGEVAFIAANRSGKALKIDEKVVTPSGYKEIGELKVGDFVIGGDGRKTKVLGVFPQGKRPCYELEFSDSSKVVCDEDHLWTMKYSGKDSKYQTKTIKEWLQASTVKVLPRRPKVTFDRTKVTVDPYLLGLLIGDGGLKHSIIITSADKAIVEYCTKQAKDWGCTLTFADRYNYRFSTNKGNRRNSLIQEIRRLKLNVGSHDKFIPTEYKHSTVKNRIAILQGLMDTDGYIDKQGQGYYYTVSKELAEDVDFVCKSLGINSRIQNKKTLYNGKHVHSYFVYMPYADFPLCRLKRKVERQRTNRGYEIALREAKHIGYHECVCIQVEKKDGLFLTNQFIPTHNTIASAFLMTCFLTGLYPPWWEGKRFDRPVKAFMVGKSVGQTKAVLQTEMMGPDGQHGTGMIPKHLIVDTTARQGVAKGVADVHVRHASGGVSVCSFMAAEQGLDIFMGHTLDVVACDEELKDTMIYTELYTRTMTRNGLIYLTYTPLSGLSPTVLRFLPGGRFPEGGTGEVLSPEGEPEGRYVVNCTWEDAPHLTEDQKTKMLASYSEVEKDARSRGIPMVGSGLVYPVIREDYEVEPFKIPSFWPRAGAIDFGWNTTCVLLGAKDPLSEILYIYACYYQGKRSTAEHVSYIKAAGEWLNYAADPSGGGRNINDGKRVFEEYISMGVSLFPADNSQVAGINRNFGLLQSGRCKVFSTCKPFFDEIQVWSYDEKTGRPRSDQADHAMDTWKYLTGDFDAIAISWDDCEQNHHDRLKSSEARWYKKPKTNPYLGN